MSLLLSHIQGYCYHLSKFHIYALVHSENEDHGIWLHHFMANRWRNSGKAADFVLGAPKSLQMVSAAMKLKDAYSLEGKL